MEKRKGENCPPVIPWSLIFGAQFLLQALILLHNNFQIAWWTGHWAICPDSYAEKSLSHQ